MTEPIGSRSATLSWLSPNEIEVRFTPGTLTGMDIAEVIAERKRMQGDKPIGLLLVVPPETELDVAIINKDHQRSGQATDHLLGLAVVANNTTSEILLRLYKAYYPTPFRAEVFTDEGEAREWLRARVAEQLSAKTR